jgi:hypothetical protein
MSHEKATSAKSWRPLWVERDFEFSHLNGTFLNILERLEGTPLRLAAKTKGLSEVELTTSVNGKWSIQVNVGHLLTLESLWLGRFDDFVMEKEELRAWNLTNSDTEVADFNSQPIVSLISDFESIRLGLTRALRDYSSQAETMIALHPRLKKPMRLIDMAYFIAEHDDHHLATIEAIKRGLVQTKG